MSRLVANCHVPRELNLKAGFLLYHTEEMLGLAYDPFAFNYMENSVVPFVISSDLFSKHGLSPREKTKEVSWNPPFMFILV